MAQNPAGDTADSQSAPSSPGPLASVSGPRLISLDFIRGLTVLGILFANITAFAQPMTAYFWPGALPGGGTPADTWVWLFQFLFIDGKMRGLFTLLFGAGIVLFVERASAKTAHPRLLQLRRLAWLLLFGLLHFFLLFRGDILTIYGTWGIAALLFVRLDPVKKLVFGLMLYGFGSLMLMLFTGEAAWLEQVPGACNEQSAEACAGLADTVAKAEKDIRDQNAIYSSGSFGDILAYTADAQSNILTKGAVFGMLETLPLILIGMALYQFGLFSGGIEPSALRRWGWIGIAVGLAIGLPMALWPMLQGFPYHLNMFVFNAAAQIPRLPMVLGMAVLLALWAPSLAHSWLGLRLQAAGRMAFSNYIGTSILMSAIFNGWGLGLFGSLNRLEMLPVVALGMGLMLVWSKPWLARFRYGPLEWLWRCLTYRRLFAMRR